MRLLVVLLCCLSALASGADAPKAPANLRCEYDQNPVGIDVAAPRLSWEVNDARRGAVQAAYQILVSHTPDPAKAVTADLLWDSGKVASDQSIHVVYKGQPLTSRQRCYWTVRTWDANGNESSYAKPSFWEMGLLNKADWQAKWIARAENAANPLLDTRMGSWIWGKNEVGENKRCYFRTSIEVPTDTKVATASLKIAADDSYTCYINGQKICSGNNWETFQQFDVAKALVPGKNLIAVEAENKVGKCGLLFGLSVACENSLAQMKNSSENCSTSGVAEPGWEKPGFDDSKWEKRALRVAKYGEEPWGRLADREYEHASCLRKEFNLETMPERARIYVSGLGIYEIHVNGKLVSEELFTPGWTNYPKHVQYRTYDVTDRLKKGANAVAVVVGNGWWGQGMASAWKDGPERAIVQVETQRADGTVEKTIASDTTWRSKQTPITMDSFYDGETYDATQEEPGWNDVNFNDKGWGNTTVVAEADTRLIAHVDPPIKVTERLVPVAITEPAPGKFVFDFGQNAAGVCELSVKAPRGTRLQLRFAEILNPDGTVYTENYRGAKATDVYIVRGEKKETWMPRFTYRGFRYAELTGFPGKPDKNTLTSCVLHSAPAITGEFECSDTLVNQIQKNIRWGQRSNMHSVPTDCPQRDERLGWTGDAQMFAPTACWNMDMASFFTKWMRDLADSAHADGSVTDIAPVNTTNIAKPAWGDVITIVPWHVYRFYGDTRLIETYYDTMAAWVKYMAANAPNNLYEREGYGDWVPVVASPQKPIGAAYYYYSTKLLGQMARVIGRTTEAEAYERSAADIATAFNGKFLNRETNTYEGGTQTANLLPLFFGITPEDRQDAVAANVVKDIAARENHLSTGFLGTGYLMPILSKYGHQDVAWILATQRSYPSWGHMIEKGGTTIWERWNSDQYKELGPDMNSFNHFALGSVGQWFYESLAGINPEQPGFKRIEIRPMPVGDLTWAKGSYHSMYGPIRSEWKIEKDSFVLTVQIPANTVATVYVPAEKADFVKEGHKPASEAKGVKFLRAEKGACVYEVGAGEYLFSAPVKAN